MKPFVRSAFNYDTNQVSRETALFDNKDGMTQQSFKEECDINTIVKRFGVTQMLPQSVQPPSYQLFEDVFDFHSAMNAIAQARESFDAMPAELRARFRNDPGEFVDFCSKEENLPEMRKLGLAIPEVVTDTNAAPVGAKENGDARSPASGAVKAAEASEGSDGAAKAK